MQRVGLAVGAMMAWVLSCSPATRTEVFTPGRSYRLTLHLTTPVRLIPERAAYFSPMIDSATLTLRVDSTSHDSVYATFSGQLRHFPVVFRSLNDSSVIIDENRDHFHALVSTRATDSGMELNGKREHETVSGTWHSLTQSSADSGVFFISPGA
jgi:hypothetical protein